MLRPVVPVQVIMLNSRFSAYLRWVALANHVRPSSVSVVDVLRVHTSTGFALYEFDDRRSVVCRWCKRTLNRVLGPINPSS